MAKITIRYLTERPGAAGELPRFFWQPSTALRAAGWRARRVPDNWASYADEAALRMAAAAAAQLLNGELDNIRFQHQLPAAAIPAAARTLGDLVRLYKASQAFTSLAPSTRRGYAQCLAKLEAWGADAPVRAIDTPRVRKLQAGLAATPAFANAVVRVLRLLLEYGRSEGWLTVNPALRPGLAASEPSGLIWPREAVDLFVATADTMGHHAMGTAVLLNAWLGQRQGDIIRMPRSVIRNGNLVLRQSKTGAGVTLPYAMVPQLQDRLEAELARHAARGGVPSTAIIVSEETGRAYLPDNFRHVFARIRAKMAEAHPSFAVDYLLPGRDMADPQAFVIRTADLTFMHLRHTAVTRLAEAGCDTGLISSISGHAQATVQQLMERYMVRTAQLARIAFQKRLDAETPALIAATVAGAGVAK